MKNLFKAIADFQQEVQVIHKSTQGYGYTYAELSTILEKINPLLKKHKLGFTQLLNGNSLQTIIFHHESGEHLDSNCNIPQGVQLKGMNDFQVLGSAITYIRRYALSAALGLVTDKDTDASGEQEKKENKSETPKDDKQWLNRNTDAYKKVCEALKSGSYTIEDIQKKYRLSKEIKTELQLLC